MPHTRVNLGSPAVFVDNAEVTEMLSQVPRLSATGSLVDQIRDSLYAAITSGTLDPGTRLREIPLSEHFGVSTTPIREALRRLEYQGLVEVHPRRGAVVTALDPATVSDLYELRLILESSGVRLASASGRPLDRIDELMAEAERYVDEQPQVTFHRLDVHLHREFSELSGNRELAATVEHVHQRIQAVRVRCAVPGRLRVAHGEHAMIVEAIRTGDPDAAEAAVRRHITSAKENVLGTLDHGAAEGRPAAVRPT